MREGLAWQPALRPPSPAATVCWLSSTTTPGCPPSTGAPSKRPATAAATAGASQVISQTVITYTYDALDRLTAADYSDGSFFHYAYDAAGNRLSETTQAESNAYTYDDANRLASLNGVAYTWDAKGNLLSDGVYSYTYDGANRLTGVTDGASAVSYAYNGLGDRLQTSAAGQTTRYTLDLVSGLTQVLHDGGYTYLYGNGRIAQYGANGGEYFLGDALGSVRQLADASGAVRLSRSYQPYGELLASNGEGESVYGFTGEATDALTGMVYLRARWYSAYVGRFISKDEWDGDYISPLSLNSWLYGFANPITNVDPSGFGPEEVCSSFDQDCIDLRPNERDLTLWLFRELKENASSEYTLKIHSFITSHKPIKIIKGYQAFYNLVQDRAKWDFKHNIRKELDSRSFVLFHGIKRSEFRWYEYSVAGNIHFGYVGRASGIPGPILHAGASWAEIKDPEHDESGEALCNIKCSSPLCGSYYLNLNWKKSLFDDPQDYRRVELGIKMFDMYHSFMTFDEFQNALKIYGYLLAQASEYHEWGWKNPTGKWPYEPGHFDGPDESKYEPIIQSLLFEK
jgi:RHS repeat-associated protein